jgi:hypothetical protein
MYKSSSVWDPITIPHHLTAAAARTIKDKKETHSMNSETAIHQKYHTWLDQVAISMAAVCAVHCLLTPVLIVALPIIATGFFAHEHFHIWMLLLVLPTTGLSIFMGCRKHKDRWTAVLSVIGVGILIAVAIMESGHHAAASATCQACDSCAGAAALSIPACAWFNTLGGLFLASAHLRNFKLCRKSRCCH